jgi:hypothetical protein
MTRRSGPSAWARRSAVAHVMSGALCVLGCGAGTGLSNHDADDHFAERAGDVETSEIHDGHADMSQDSLTDAASESPALSCANVGCSAPPLCAEGCQAPCGCCFCSEGEIDNVNGVSLRCAGGCFAPVADPNACVKGPPITSPPPAVVGCYVGTAQCGWQKEECLCELEVTNPAGAPATVQFAFTVVPATVIPSLTGLPDVEISFDDPAGTWAATWSAQAGSGTTFAVTKNAGVTTVRLGTASVELATVPLSASQSTVAKSIVTGTPTGTGVNMAAAVTDAAGRSLAFVAGLCVEIPRP